MIKPKVTWTLKPRRYIGVGRGVYIITELLAWLPRIPALESTLPLLGGGQLSRVYSLQLLSIYMATGRGPRL